MPEVDVDPVIDLDRSPAIDAGQSPGIETEQAPVVEADERTEAAVDPTEAPQLAGETETTFGGYGPLFDEEWYRSQSDELRDIADPVTHYRTVGWLEGLDPSPVFSVAWYLRQHPDRAERAVEPLEDYLSSGWQLGFDPNPYFSTSWYLAQYPDVASEGVEPLGHYLAHGWQEGRDPHPHFSTDRYLTMMPGVGAKKCPLGHFLRSGDHFEEVQSPVHASTDVTEAPVERLSVDAVDFPLEIVEVPILVRTYLRSGGDFAAVLAHLADFPTVPDLQVLAPADVVREIEQLPTAGFTGAISIMPSEQQFHLYNSSGSQAYAAILLVNFAVFDDGRIGKLEERSVLHNAAGCYQLVCNAVGTLVGSKVGLLCPKRYELRRDGKASVGRSVWLEQAGVLWMTPSVFEVCDRLVYGPREDNAKVRERLVLAVPGALRQAGQQLRYCSATVPFNGIRTYDGKARPFSYLRAETYREKIAAYRQAAARQPKVAVYTAIVGGYDSLRPPEVLNPEIEYVCYSDRSLPDYGLYSVRPMPYVGSDDTRTARFVKTHPHELLGDREVAIWADANVLLQTDLGELLERFRRSDAAVAAIPHPLRESLAEEATACLTGKKDVQHALDEQLSFFASIGFETDSLLETNLMMFKLKDPRTKVFFDTWWNIIDRFSRRDQLSVNYALSRAELSFLPLFGKGFSLRDTPGFALFSHGKDLGLETLKAEFRDTIARPFAGPSYADRKAERLASIPEVVVDVVICVHNGWSFVEECLDSVRRTLGHEHRVILVDDGSLEETASPLAAYAHAHPAFSLIRHEQPLGYTKAVNAGLRASRADLVILLNSDTLVEGDWIGKMTDAAYASETTGIVGPMSNAASYQSIPDFRNAGDQTAINELPAWLSLAEMNRLCERWSLAGHLPRTPLAHGFCFAVRREVIDAIGLMDEQEFPRGFGEENDYCFRATDAGFGIVVATHTYVFHAKSKSYMPGDRSALVAAGGRAVRARHGVDRVKRATQAMEYNNVLRDFRERAARLYAAGPPA